MERETDHGIKLGHQPKCCWAYKLCLLEMEFPADYLYSRRGAIYVWICRSIMPVGYLRLMSLWWDWIWSCWERPDSLSIWCWIRQTDWAFPRHSWESWAGQVWLLLKSFTLGLPTWRLPSAEATHASPISISLFPSHPWCSAFQDCRSRLREVRWLFRPEMSVVAETFEFLQANCS